MPQKIPPLPSNATVLANSSIFLPLPDIRSQQECEYAEVLTNSFIFTTYSVLFWG